MKHVAANLKRGHRYKSYIYIYIYIYIKTCIVAYIYSIVVWFSNIVVREAKKNWRWDPDIVEK
jgi:hypothetical protein